MHTTRKILALILTLLCYQTIFCQTQSTNVSLDIPVDHTSDIIKFTPFKLAAEINPALELSYERRTGPNFSTQLMASYLLPMSIMDIGNEFKPNIKGFRFSLEEKFYWKKSAPLGPYVSFEINYLKNQYQDIWNFGVEDSLVGFTGYADTFGIQKQTCSFNLKFGYQLIVKRISIDFYAGLGLRYKNVTHSDRMNPDDEMEMPRHPNVYYETNRAGKYWTVCVPLNVRVGWTF